jgi:ATP-dependent helicase/nuclease subunit B
MGENKMSLRFIFGRAGSGKSHYCLDEIKNKLENGASHKLVMLVPEQFSFQSERNLLKAVGATGIIKAEVLSFSRLCHRVFDQVGGVTRKRINDAGKSMMIYKIMEEINGDLKIFGRASKQQGFVDIIADAIKEFKRYNITPEILLDSVSNVEEDELKYKLSDLSLIYSSFEEMLHKSYIDTEDEMILLADKIDSCDLYDGAEIWLDEFTTFTPQQYTVIEKLLKKCSRVNITLSSDTLSKAGNVDNTDVFSVTKNTEKRLLNIAAENNIAYDQPIDLNKDCCERFKEAKELQHLERHYASFPYSFYKEEPEKLRLYKANNSYDEVEQVAKEIIGLVRDDDYRFRDIAVVCRDLDNYEKITSAIFNEYNIPYFLDKKREITRNPLVVLITSVFDIFTKNWSYEAVFRYLKTGLSGINTESIDRIENYVLANGIRGKKWTEEELWSYRINYRSEEEALTLQETLTLNQINETREAIIEPLIKFQKDIKRDSTIKNICVALYDFLIHIGALETIESWSNSFKEKGENDLSNEYSQIVDLVMKILDQLVEVMGEEKVTLDKFVKIMSVGFEKYEMGLIPASLDEVVIGNISRIRSHGVKALFVIGVNDGIFPAVSKDEGILSDKDRISLRERGVELAPDTKVKAFEEQFLVYTTLTTPSHYMMISYPMADFEGKALRPSVIVSRIKKIFPKLMEESDIAKKRGYEEKLEKIVAPEPTFNKMVAALRRDYEGKEVEEIWSPVFNWFYDKKEWKRKTYTIFKGLEYSNQVEKVDVSKIRELYGKPLNFSVSRLEQYAGCPFAYYVKYGLKAKDRKIYEFSSPDFGSFMHGVLDKFSGQVVSSNLKWQELNKDWCKSTIYSIVDEELARKSGSILNSSARYKHVADRLKRILTKSVTIIAEHIKKSSFEPLANELVFGVGGDLPPIKLSLPSGEEIQLMGRIDRVDSMDLDGGTYLRIIDYKSGNKKFELSQVYYGLQLQLLVYLDALISNAERYIEKQAIPGAILYFKIDDPIIKCNQNMSDEEIEKEVMKRLKMNGLLLKDAKVVREMDKDMQGFSLIIPARINKDGSLSKSPSVISIEQFGILRNYVRETLINLCQEMLGGNIEIRPSKEKKYSACNFCDYSAICQFDSTMKNNSYRYVNKKKDEEVWSLMEKKLEGEVIEEGSAENGGN